MRKSQSSQQDESRAQSADSSKGCIKPSRASNCLYFFCYAEGRRFDSPFRWLKATQHCGCNTWLLSSFHKSAFFTPLLLRLNILQLWNILSFGIRLLLKLQGECSKLLAVSERHSITHNSWTDRARKSVKTSLDPWDNKESNENDKNIPLHVKFLKKIHVCVFAVLNYWQNPVKMGKNVPRIPSSLSDPVFRFADRRNTRKTGSCRKKSIWAVLGWDLGCKIVG